MRAVVDDTAAIAPLERESEAVRYRLLAIGVLALTAILFFARLGARALWSSEFRWAEIAREMQLTGNYFWPTINGRLYYDKPLLSYWLILGAAHLTGSLNETAARIPCAIAGLLAVGLLMVLARRFYDWQVAVLSGFILATSMSFVFFSRTASADVETITGELAALLIFFSWRERPRRLLILAFWLVMSITSLTKGLLGFVLPIAVVSAYSCFADGWRDLYEALSSGPIARRIEWLIRRNRWLFNWNSIPAIAIALAIYSMPFEISSARMGSDAGLYMVYRENVVRFFHPFDHKGPIYLYAYIIFELMAPWSALLPAALAQGNNPQSDEDASKDRFALVYFWTTFAFFTLSGSRRSYYILPILPAGAILVARLLLRSRQELSRWARRLLFASYFAIGAIVIVGAGGMLAQSMRPGAWKIYPPTPDRAVFSIFWILSAATVFYALRALRPRTIAVSMASIAYLLMTYIYIFAMPTADAYRGEKPFALQVKQQLHNDFSRLAFFRAQGPVFYMDAPKPVPTFEDPAALRAAIRKNGFEWLIVRGRDVPRIGLPLTPTAHEATFPWESESETRNKLLLFEIGSPPAKK